jgi:nucleotide-binding universal stress UspA family protein
MLNSVLLHIDSAQRSEPVIELGVRLATRSAARIRGLSVVDTRRLAALSSTSESACHVVSEFDHLLRLEAEHNQVRLSMSQACGLAGLDFDVRRLRGNPLEVLATEAQFHDLVVAALPRKSQELSLSAADLVHLLGQGVPPLLVVRSAEQPLRRVLLVNDGTPQSARAIRQFVKQDLLPRAELRLLAIGASQELARSSLAQMVEYCRCHKLVFESGWLVGSPRQALIPYAHKWGADLVVLGVQRVGPVVRRLWGELAEAILRTTDLALYASA